MRHITKQRHGFTIVELIVVITILVILGTIAFVSLGNFAGSARDSLRISNAANLYKALSLVNIRTGLFPMPDAPSVTLTYSGAAIGYQGYAGEAVQSTAKVGGSMNDTTTGLPLTYSVNAKRDKAQLFGFLEDQANVSYGPFADRAYAASVPLHPFTR